MSSRRIALRFMPKMIDYGTRQVLGGVRRFANGAGWRCVLDATAGDAGAAAYDGIVSADGNRRWRGRGSDECPVVLVVAQDMASPRSPAVSPSRYGVGLRAATHLRDQGYEQFAHVGYTFHTASAEQESGYVRALRRRGLGWHSVVFPRGPKRRSRPNAVPRLREVLGEWLGKEVLPVGVFAGDAMLGHVLATAAAERGLRVPEDVGIVVAGDDPLFCEGAECPLTAVDLRQGEVGYRAAMLLERLMDGGRPPSSNVTLTPRLVPRRSTDRRLLGDAAVADALAYIARHCAGPLRVDEVAAAVGLERRQLLRRMHRVRERTVEQEIVLARMERARDLLAGGGYGVAEVARACGFANAGSFGRAWRRYHGVAPSVGRVVRPHAPVVPDPFEHAKRLLATTRDSLGSVARSTGFSSVHVLRKEFWLREHMGPGEWRRQNREPVVEEKEPRRFIITFVGPTGEVDEERVYELPAVPARGRRGR